jgi:hypothetical protein
MRLKRWDLGEIIRNHTYIREIYPSHLEENCLLSSKELVDKLCRIYDYLGVKCSDLKDIKVKVKLPDSSNPFYKNYWHETTIRKSEETPIITEIDRFIGYIRKEVILASSQWMADFESFQGDKVVISPCVPVLQIQAI